MKFSMIFNLLLGILIVSPCFWSRRVKHSRAKLAARRAEARAQRMSNARLLGNVSEIATLGSSSEIHAHGNASGINALGNSSEIHAHAGPENHPYSGARLGTKLGGGSFGKVYSIHFPDAPNWAGALKHIDMNQARRRGVKSDDIAREFWMQHHVGKYVGLSAEVLSWGWSSGDAYGIVEMLSGGSLQDYVTEVWGGSGEGMGKQADELAKAMYAQLVYATMSMHRANVVHMDFKPDNVMINNYKCAAKYDPKNPQEVFKFGDWEDMKLAEKQQELEKKGMDRRQIQAKLQQEQRSLLSYWQKTMKPFVSTPEEWEREKCAIKLIDFGLSCICTQQTSGCAHQSAGMGTPVFMTKEQFEAAKKGHKANQNMDIWAMGLTLYFMLFGKFPHLENGRLNNEMVMQEKYEDFQSAPWYWIMYKSLYSAWAQAAAVLKNTMCSVRERSSAKQLWDTAEYIQDYKEAAMRADQREKTSETRRLPASAGSVSDSSGNQKVGAVGAAADSVWSFFKIDWGKLFSKFGS